MKLEIISNKYWSSHFSIFRLALWGHVGEGICTPAGAALGAISGFGSSATIDGAWYIKTLDQIHDGAFIGNMAIAAGQKLGDALP